MKTSIAVLASVIASLVAIILVKQQRQQKQRRDNFDAAGLVFNKPPEWFNKAAYNASDWIVAYNPDQLSKPECMHYRGDEKELNYLSSAYRFWRM
jgi:hypothetical protein